MESGVSVEKDYSEQGRMAYASCNKRGSKSSPISHVNLMMGDIRRMEFPETYRVSLLTGFMEAAEEAGDQDTVRYVDRILNE